MGRVWKILRDRNIADNQSDFNYHSFYFYLAIKQATKIASHPRTGMSCKHAGFQQ